MVVKMQSFYNNYRYFIENFYGLNMYRIKILIGYSGFDHRNPVIRRYWCPISIASSFFLTHVSCRPVRNPGVRSDMDRARTVTLCGTKGSFLESKPVIHARTLGSWIHMAVSGQVWKSSLIASTTPPVQNVARKSTRRLKTESG